MKKALLVLSTIMLISIFVFSGCTASVAAPAPVSAPSAAPPPSPAILQPPPASKWVADGIISPGEYTGTKTLDIYELRWSSDGKNISIAIKAKTSGWVAVGIQPAQGMKDADMVLGFVQEGKPTVYDMYGIAGPPSPDISAGGKNDILEFGGKEEGGYTIIEFKRALDTGDKYDRPLVKGVNKLIWAYSTEDSLTKHAKTDRGYIEIELY